jgi:hypothetical protein
LVKVVKHTQLPFQCNVKVNLLLKELLPPIFCQANQSRTEKEHGGGFGDCGSRGCFETLASRITIESGIFENIIISHDVAGVVDLKGLRETGKRVGGSNPVARSRRMKGLQVFARSPFSSVSG